MHIMEGTSQGRRLRTTSKLDINQEKWHGEKSLKIKKKRVHNFLFESLNVNC